MWLPETAVDRSTLRLLAEEGIAHTILAPWQASEPYVDTRRPYRVELGGGRSIVVAFYDGGLSGAVSFEPRATADADRFAQDVVEPRMAPGSLARRRAAARRHRHRRRAVRPPPAFRDLFLQRLVQPRPDGDPRGFDVVSLAEALTEPAGHPFRSIGIEERTSWSCHHGVLRWTAECPCVPDGRWKGPLRAALERLAAGDRRGHDERGGRLPGSPDPWAARDAYVDVVIGSQDADAFAGMARRDDADPEHDAHVPGAHGGAALAARDVRQRRAGSGTTPSDPRRRRSCAPRRGPRGSSTRFAERRPGAPAGRGPRAAQRRPARVSTAPRSTGVALAEVGQPGPDDVASGRRDQLMPTG